MKKYRVIIYKKNSQDEIQKEETIYNNYREARKSINQYYKILNGLSFDYPTLFPKDKQPFYKIESVENKI